MQVHSVRLPGYVISAEVIFGMVDRKLSIRQLDGGRLVILRVAR
jgi:hypothetical protein